MPAAGAAADCLAPGAMDALNERMKDAWTSVHILLADLCRIWNWDGEAVQIATCRGAVAGDKACQLNDTFSGLAQAGLHRQR